MMNSKKEMDLPWNPDVVPESLKAQKDASIDILEKFTNDEWTGKSNGSVKNADVFAVNVQEAATGSTLSVPYHSVEKAIEGAVEYKKEVSDYVQFLTGQAASLNAWNVIVLQNQNVALGNDYRDFYKPSYVVDTEKGWVKNLALPASWTSRKYREAGIQDFPIYINVDMPWQSKYDENVPVPQAPVNYNPVGLYRKTFDVDRSMMDLSGKVYISFQGVESAYYVYLNGKEVGYSEDSFSPHSFDITDYLTSSGRNNVLAVKVHKFCDGTWMEDQDMFYDGGIFRDVYLYATPLVHISDYFVRTELIHDYTDAELILDVAISNSSKQAVSDYAVDVRLFDSDKNLFINDFTIDFANIQAAAADGKKTSERNAGSKTIKNPKLWSAEDPNLYTMVLTLYHKSTGAYIESVSQQFGFRQIEFTGTKVDAAGNAVQSKSDYQPMKINGRPFLLKGTNRHDTDPLYGKHVPKKTVEQDILTMKRFNLNAVRTSHYSNDEYLYYLCDKFGLYVMGETNLECHAIMGNEDAQKNFKLLAMDRTKTAFNRLKNFPSIIMWSIGNECYYSKSAAFADGMYYDLIWYFKNNDNTRPVHSESAHDANGVDMDSDMYPCIDVVKSKAAQNMPYVLCEYNHSMGNAGGNLKEYWDIIRKGASMLGAFVWDWADQSRISKLPRVYKLTEASNLKAKGKVYFDSVNKSPEAEAMAKQSIRGYTLLFSSAYHTALSGSGKEFTLEIICKPSGASGNQILMAKGDTQISFKTDSGGRLEFFAYNQGWNSVTAAKPANWENNWHHVAVSYKAGTVSPEVNMYCDGRILTTSGTTNTIISSNAFGLGIGYCAETGRTFNGEISVARIYNRALSLEEIRRQYSETPAIGRNSSDVLAWVDYSDFNTNQVPSAGYDYFQDTGETYQVLYKQEAQGSFYGYGGDFGDQPNDGSFSGNGLVSANRSPHPALYDVKYQYQNFWFSADNNRLADGYVSLYNESSFDNADRYDVVWTLMEDDREIGTGNLEATGIFIESREKKNIHIPYLDKLPKEKKAGAEYYLNLSVQLKKDTLWAQSGHEIAYEQFVLLQEAKKIEKTIDIRKVAVDPSNEEFISVTGEDFSFQLDKATGQIKNYRYQDNLLLKEGPRPNFWRASLNNDRFFDGKWQLVTSQITAGDIKVTTNEYGYSVITTDLSWKGAAGIAVTVTYTIEGNGAVTVAMSSNAREENFTPNRYLRIGTNLVLPEGYENVTVFGNGYQGKAIESMWDRKTGAKLGKYTTTVTDLFFPYLHTQDTGTITDTKWFSITNPEKTSAMVFASADGIEMQALHFTTDDLTQAKHPYELTKLKETIVGVNLRSQGTGNASCGPDVLTQYTLPNDRIYSYQYTMIPYTTGTNVDLADITRSYRNDAAEVLPDTVTVNG